MKKHIEKQGLVRAIALTLKDAKENSHPSKQRLEKTAAQALEEADAIYSEWLRRMSREEDQEEASDVICRLIGAYADAAMEEGFCAGAQMMIDLINA